MKYQYRATGVTVNRHSEGADGEEADAIPVAMCATLRFADDVAAALNKTHADPPWYECWLVMSIAGKPQPAAHDRGQVVFKESQAYAIARSMSERDPQNPMRAVSLVDYVMMGMAAVVRAFQGEVD